MKKIAIANKEKTIVLLSGGMDSLLCMALKYQKGDILHTLHFDYGQKTFKKECACAEQIADFYNVTKENQKTIDLKFMKQIGGSALNDELIKLSTTGENLTQSIVPTSYVPYRNTVMLSLALSYAEVINADNIAIGAVQDDELGYPDCRKNYFDAFQQMAKLGGDNPNINIETPLINLKKTEIVNKLFALKAPIEFSWSCYQATNIACGVCDSCRLRLAAFKSAHKVDPIDYQHS